jgi:hypothetical protein
MTSYRTRVYSALQHRHLLLLSTVCSDNYYIWNLVNYLECGDGHCMECTAERVTRRLHAARACVRCTGVGPNWGQQTGTEPSHIITQPFLFWNTPDISTTVFQVTVTLHCQVPSLTGFTSSVANLTSTTEFYTGSSWITSILCQQPQTLFL